MCMFSTRLLMLSSVSSKLPKSQTKMNKTEEKKGNQPSTRPFAHTQVCTSRTFTGNGRRWELTHTSFAGTWHAHLRDGGENRVVHIALANQVNYPVCDLFDGAPVQLVFLGSLAMTRKACREHVLHWRRPALSRTSRRAAAAAGIRTMQTWISLLAENEGSQVMDTECSKEKFFTTYNRLSCLHTSSTVEPWMQQRT